MSQKFITTKLEVVKHLFPEALGAPCMNAFECDVRHGTVPLNGLVVFHASVALISGNLADGEIFGRRINKIGKQLRIACILIPNFNGSYGVGTNSAHQMDLHPFVLLSHGAIFMSKIRRAERRGEKIPLGYALDADGLPTCDPKAALGGVVLPIGTYKGSGLSMLMDIFGGVISGANYGGDV